MRNAVEDKEEAESSLTQLKHEMLRRVEEAVDEKENRDKDYEVLTRKYQSIKGQTSREKGEMKEEITRLK